jgi:peptidoglycan/LPS O-acetylase OafA/YrhL
VTQEPKGRINDIEALRAIAVIFTMIHHVGGLVPGPVIQFLHRYMTFWTGVDLFFAISGFVIARGIYRRFSQTAGTREFRAVLMSFWVKRAYRIWPASWVWLTVFLMISFAFASKGTIPTFHQELRGIVASFLQVQNIHSWYCAVSWQWNACGNVSIA